MSFPNQSVLLDTRPQVWRSCSNLRTTQFVSRGSSTTPGSSTRVAGERGGGKVDRAVVRGECDGGGAGVDSSFPPEVGAVAADRARAQEGCGGDLAVALPSAGRRSTSSSRAGSPVAR